MEHFYLLLYDTIIFMLFTEVVAITALFRLK